MKRIAWIVLSGVLLGCGGAEKEQPSKVVSVKDYESATYSVEAQEGMVQGLLGNVTDDEIHRVFDNNMRRLLKCYEDEVFELEEMEGSLRFELEVASDGSVNHAFVAESNLGSIVTEECMLRYIEGFHFDRVPGGVAILSYPLELLPPYDHPAPKAWSREQLAGVLAEHQDEISGCGAFDGVVTLYIGQGGVVLSAGASGSDKSAFKGAACVAKAARGWTFADPGGDLIKAAIDF